jgi:hypothetical protein
MNPKPNDMFFLLANLNLNGTLELESLKPMTLGHARTRAVEIVSTYGGKQVIIKCRVVQAIDIHDTKAFKELRATEISDNKLGDLLENALPSLIHTFVTQYVI